jgi:hypothetical protein
MALCCWQTTYWCLCQHLRARAMLATEHTNLRPHSIQKFGSGEFSSCQVLE